MPSAGWSSQVPILPDIMELHPDAECVEVETALSAFQVSICIYMYVCIKLCCKFSPYPSFLDNVYVRSVWAKLFDF